MEFFIFFFRFLWMCVCIKIANKNNRNTIIAGILGCFYGIFAVLFYWAIGENKEKNDNIVI